MMDGEILVWGRLRSRRLLDDTRIFSGSCSAWQYKNGEGMDSGSSEADADE
jgi:hypothetical protein